MARILIVDDDPIMLRAIEDWLTFEKHTVSVANSGRAGWQQLQDNEYDLLILDWDMADMTGIDILRKFRAAGGTTRVIMLTGHTSSDDTALGLDSGADAYMTKPFHVKELASRIRAALRTPVASATPPTPLGHGNEAVLERADLAGTKLAASYEFISVLGEGKDAIVFQAKHPRLDKLVAIKVLRPTELTETSITLFEREAHAVSRINHYNIVGVHDWGVTERNLPYIVMEHIDGQSLEDKICKEGPLPLTVTATIFLQMCSGLQEAHSQGIIHRDLKPDNVVLQSRSDRDDWVKIVDFGFAHLLEGQKRLTEVGKVVGSPGYLAPERLTGASPDVRTDIYSLGVILFETLTARPFIEADTMEALLIKAINGKPEPPSTYRQEIAAGSAFDTIVMKATDRNPSKRYQSVAEMLNELAAFRNQLLQDSRS